MVTSLSKLLHTQQQSFQTRHIGPSTQDTEQMLKSLSLDSIEALISQTVPQHIRKQDTLAVPDACHEEAALAQIAGYAKENRVTDCYIGMGYYPCFTPTVIQRNILENPGWYTAYTPYQPEISQGRLEALLNYQQMIMDLTGMDLANASLLDEGTAAAEAMTLCKRSNRKNKSDNFFVDDNCHPQTIAVVKTRAHHMGYTVTVASLQELGDHEYFGALIQYPGSNGEVNDCENNIKAIKDNNALAVIACDLLNLALLKSPGELGADVVLGNSQRFGVPMGGGGPHAAFFATKEDYKRSVPGRIIGQSIDKLGNPALRMALQTREQHIRREKATSNICTAQALLAIMAGFYAVYHGPQGIREIAQRVHLMAQAVDQTLAKNGIKQLNSHYFDTLRIEVTNVDEVLSQANDAGITLRVIADNQLCISLDETKNISNLEKLVEVITGKNCSADLTQIIADIDDSQSKIPANLQRTTDILQHPVFNQYHSETELLRYMHSLERKDIALNYSMIALGSCTMKLNPTSAMIPITWSEFAQIHPFAPQEHLQGYATLCKDLESFLAACTGYDKISLQPNAGSQGEYAGLLAIKRYHQSRGEEHRDICLIPSSAHGTNPASASMVNYKVVIVACDDNGNIDLADLAAKIEKHSENIAAIMITYPSTHGVFEEAVTEVCDMVHAIGGQVYVDGANLNAMVGLAEPGKFGADVSHLNLHKTFAIPHGGGGPGMGPIGVRSHLAPFLPTHPLNHDIDSNDVVSAAHWGSAGILPISWMYIRMLGNTGLLQASQVAILNANYIAQQLEPHFPILYRGSNNRVAHECIIDLRPLKASSGISEEDIAKRLMDFGFHAPTMSFPVAGTLMIEPTESESLAELNRFCDAMIQIRHEIASVEQGELPLDNNPLVNAPHSQVDLLNWDKPYSIEQACFPQAAQKSNKYWTPVNRIDNVHGDRNFCCTLTYDEE